jgi:hypothetical protein
MFHARARHPAAGLLLLACWALLGPSAARADDDDRPWFHETVSLRAGAIFAFLDTDFTVNGVDLDAESHLKLDDFEVLPSVDLRWRFTDNKRHRLEIGYFSILRNGDARITRELDLPDLPPITIGAQTDTFLDVHVASLTYGYSFLHDENKELGIFLGLDFIVADAGVEAQLSGSNVVIKDDDLLDENFNVPFPTAGAYFNWAFNEKWAAMSRFQYFGLKFDGVEGELFRGTVRLQHATFENVELFVAYDVLGASVDFDSDSFEDISLVYHGPILGLEILF